MDGSTGFGRNNKSQNILRDTGDRKMWRAIIVYTSLRNPTHKRCFFKRSGVTIRKKMIRNIGYQVKQRVGDEMLKRKKQF